MELWDDNLLNYQINRKENLSVAEIHEILLQSNNSSRITNENKIIHGNLNLENIMIKYDYQEKKSFTIKLN